MAITTKQSTESESAEAETDTKTVGERTVEVATRYEESKTEIDPSELSIGIFTENAVEITYRTTGENQKTVRCDNPILPTPTNDVPQGCVEFHYTDEKYVEYHYRYDVTNQRLLAVGSYRVQTIGYPDDILSIKLVEYPEPAPINGTVQTGVGATIYYHSPRTERIQELSLFVQTVSGEGEMVKGELEDGRNVVAHTTGERDILKDTEQGKKRIGKVAGIVFPLGHGYTVRIEGLTDRQATERVERQIQTQIESALSGGYTDADIEVEVEHSGRLNA